MAQTRFVRKRKPRTVTGKQAVYKEKGECPVDIKNIKIEIGDTVAYVVNHGERTGLTTGAVARVTAKQIFVGHDRIAKPETRSLILEKGRTK